MKFTKRLLSILIVCAMTYGISSESNSSNNPSQDMNKKIINQSKCLISFIATMLFNIRSKNSDTKSKDSGVKSKNKKSDYICRKISKRSLDFSIEYCLEGQLKNFTNNESFNLKNTLWKFVPFFGVFLGNRFNDKNITEDNLKFIERRVGMKFERISDDEVEYLDIDTYFYRKYWGNNNCSFYSSCPMKVGSHTVKIFILHTNVPEYDGIQHVWFQFDNDPNSILGLSSFYCYNMGDARCDVIVNFKDKKAYLKDGNIYDKCPLFKDAKCIFNNKI